jgi:ATP-dependent DNA helicase Q4
MAQERSQVGQLHNVWSTFNTRAHPNCWQSAEECDKTVDGDLKFVIKAYFESGNDVTKSELEALSTARKNSEFLQSVIPDEEPVNWDGVSRDIRSFITSHGDLELSGRAIARVFHGIDSPCFPAMVWGRERRYWRRHLDVDFNLLRKCATKELVKFK